MPYDMNETDVRDINNFYNLMDKVCTELFIGEIWHERAGNEFRKTGLRGWGRWADAEAHGDMKTRLCIEKLLRDYCDYAVTIDATDAQRAMAYTMNGATALKSTLELWHKREIEFIDILNKAIMSSAINNISIYKELVRLADEVQGEATRVKMCMKRLELAGYNPHDIGIVSMILHKHYEDNPHDQTGNVNLG